MKKAISIILILCMSLLFTSCESGPPIDKNIYGAEDWSYIMVYGIKYVKVEEPFVIGFNSGVPDIWYTQCENTNLNVFTYKETQRYPRVGIFNDGFQLFEVTLPNDINIKFLNECGSYCLPEDKEIVENMLSNISWSKNTISGEVVGRIGPKSPLISFSEKFSLFLASICESFKTQDQLFVFDSEEATCIMDLYQYDNREMLVKDFASVYIKGDKFYVFPAENLLRFSSEGELADYTWEDLSSQEIPEEFHDEIMTLYDTYKDANQ